MRITVDASELIQTMHNLGTNFGEALTAGVQEVADEIESRAKSMCPVGETGGTLRGSIQSNMKSEGEHPVAEVFSDAMYAVYVHEGTGIYSRTGRGRTDVPWTYFDDATGQYARTSGMQATPFLEDAANEVRPQIPEIMRDAISRTLGG